MRLLLATLMLSLVLSSACSSRKDSSLTSSNDPNFIPYTPQQYQDPGQYGGGGSGNGITDISGQVPQGSVAVIFGNVNSSQNPQFLGGVTMPSDPNSVCTSQFASLLRAYAANYSDPPQLFQFDGVNYTFLDYVTDSPYFAPRFRPDDILSLCY